MFLQGFGLLRITIALEMRSLSCVIASIMERVCGSIHASRPSNAIKVCRVFWRLYIFTLLKMFLYQQPIIGIKYDKPTIYIIRRDEEEKITRCRVPVRELLKSAPVVSSVKIAAGLIDAHYTWFKNIKADQVVKMVEKIRIHNCSSNGYDITG